MTQAANFCTAHETALLAAQQRLLELETAALAAAASDFRERLAATGVPPTVDVDGLRKVYDLWVSCAELAHAGAAHSDDYARAVGDLVNAGSRWRRELARQSAITPPTPTPASAEQTGCSARDVVWHRGKLRLYRYRPLAGTLGPAHRVPLLIVYALVNRPYVMDLEENRSLIRGLLQAGQDVYLVDWGYPDAADRSTTLTDYVEVLLAGCVQHLRDAHRLDAVNLLGVCQGGVLSLCYAALHPDRVRNLVTMVTPVDCQTSDDLLSKWLRYVDVPAWVGGGNVPGPVLTALFIALLPYRLGQQKYLHLLLRPPDPQALATFLRLERWIFDSPDQAGAGFEEFAVRMYQENRLARHALAIGGCTVDLRTLRLPILNIYGSRDHLVPSAAAQALGRLVASRDYTGREFDLGHIGMFVSARAQREVPPAVAAWLAAR